jgi:undecaprenyl-diphosphatase
MNGFDLHIILFLNSFARRSWTFDWLVSTLDGNYLVKGGVMIALLLWGWYAEDAATERRRARIVAGLFAACAAVLVARVLSFALPFRGRAIYEPILHFTPPFSTDGQDLTGWWTSFPSDNAVLFFALAATVFAASRRAGVVAYAHAMITVAFARVYLGMHHPTDILGGAVIGVGMVQLALLPSVQSWMIAGPIAWLSDRPQVFYPMLFLLLFAICTVFDPIFALGHVAREITSQWKVFQG